MHVVDLSHTNCRLGRCHAAVHGASMPISFILAAPAKPVKHVSGSSLVHQVFWWFDLCIRPGAQGDSAPGLQLCG